MNLNEAKQMAIILMDKHGLMGWRFEFDNSKRRFGVCNYTYRKIGLSKHLVELNPEHIVKNTILHEIAHALTEGHGHGFIWQQKAIEIGCDGKRCYSTKNVAIPKGNYTAVCPICKFEHSKLRRPKYRSSCAKCGNETFDVNRSLNLERK